MISFDIDILYTNISTEETAKVIKKSHVAWAHTHTKKDGMPSLISVLCSSSGHEIRPMNNLFQYLLYQS
jgi:hypothetical protein